MDVLVILAHPHEESFNHAIAKEALVALEHNNHGVYFHDLYAEGFDPVLPFGEIPKDADVDEDVVKHCEELSSADGIVIIHPNWWGQPPAILKGWVDRVVRPGVAYEFLEGDEGEGVPVGLLKARTAIVFNTANTPMEREQAVFGDPLQLLWKNCIFDLCGVPVFHREMFTIMVTSTLKQRQEWLGKVRELMNRHFPESRV
jgi:putative NADPH-quinone reductase